MNCSNDSILACPQFFEDLGGDAPVPGGYGQVNVKGAIDLGRSVLDAHLTNGFRPTPGEVFTVVANDDIDPVRGQFRLPVPGTDPTQYRRLAEGATARRTSRSTGRQRVSS